MTVSSPLLTSKILPESPTSRPPPGTFEAGSAFSCSTLLFTASVGSGVLALPSAAKGVGLGLGLLILLGACLISATSDWILGRAVSISGEKTYGSILGWSVAYTKGRHGQGKRLPAFDAFMAVYQAAAIVTYLVFLGDFVPSVIQVWFDASASRTLALVCIVYLAVLPLSVGSEISSLRAVGSFSLWVMAVTALIAVCKTPWNHLDQDQPANTTPSASADWRQVMHALSLGTFAYMNQVNAVCITSELHNPTRRRLASVCTTTALCLFLCYATLMSAVYLTFGQATTANFLQNYPVDDAAVNGCRVAVSLMLILACPLNLFPVTTSFFHAIDRCDLASAPRVRIFFNTIVLTICLLTAVWVSSSSSGPSSSLAPFLGP
ncbi:hypothetical protein FOZ63_030714 [Perkinsus olseni]|uniref:Amino acid transporter transmembrane domain-containing protein n=2 Tax=Perkinsus olseni TaxID=32597 RepID=A0A7J6TJA3_PEROL|nr:hypothetical protein FOZ63_030714 [Perkinsus olseni]